MLLHVIWSAHDAKEVVSAAVLEQLHELLNEPICFFWLQSGNDSKMYLLIAGRCVSHEPKHVSSG